MNVITIQQPWASLAIEGIKPIENRTWPCPKKYIGERVLIHAAAKDAGSYTKLLTQDQKNEVMGYGWTHGMDSYKDLYVNQGCIIGSVEIGDCVINHPSIWAEKSIDCKNGCPDIEKCPIGMCPHKIYNWVLANPVKFPEPIPVKGKLRFWDYPQIHAEPEEEGGALFCHCSLPVKEITQVTGDSRLGYYCRYCGGKWYK